MMPIKAKNFQPNMEILPEPTHLSSVGAPHGVSSVSAKESKVLKRYFKQMKLKFMNKLKYFNQEEEEGKLSSESEDSHRGGRKKKPLIPVDSNPEEYYICRENKNFYRWSKKKKRAHVQKLWRKIYN